MKEIKDGFSASTGMTIHGKPYTSVLLFKDCDHDYIAPIEGSDRKNAFLQDKTLKAFKQCSLDTPRKLILLVEDDEIVLSTANRIYGPSIPKKLTPVPIICFIEKNEGHYDLIVNENQVSKTVFTSNNVMTKPTIELIDGTYYMVFNCDVHKQRYAYVIDMTGEVIFKCLGNKPRIGGNSKGVYIIYEKVTSGRTSVILENIHLPNKSVVIEGDLYHNFNAGIVCDDTFIHVSYEGSIGFGQCYSMVTKRDIYYSKFTRDLEVLVQCKLPIITTACYEPDRSITENHCPTYPMIVLDEQGEVVVAYHKFHSEVMRGFGWHLYSQTFVEGQWSGEKRLSQESGSVDARQGLYYANGRRYLAMHVNKNQTLHSTAIIDSKVIIDDVDAEVFYPSINYSKDQLAPALKPRSIEAEDTLINTITGMGEMQIMIGEMHAHSCYSKCMSSIDGTPEDNIRYYRDQLGFDFVTLTDHLHQMSNSETIWHFDVLEEECGSVMNYLYGSEPGTLPGRHANFYAYDREVKDYFRMIILTNLTRQQAYKQMKNLLPNNSITAIRHFHGDHLLDEKMMDTFDPQLEFSMESIQNRGCVMHDYHHEETGLPLFPTNFLNKGKKVGIVGGTDHTNGSLNPQVKLGCTGFIMEEVSNKAYYEAIVNRKTYAIANGKAYVYTKLAGAIMGEDVTLKVHTSYELRVAFSTLYPMNKGKILRNGQVIETQLVGGMTEGTICFEVSSDSVTECWYTITLEGESAYTLGKDYDIDDPCYPWLLVDTSPYFVKYTK